MRLEQEHCFAEVCFIDCCHFFTEMKTPLKNSAKVCNSVVAHGFCIGCGVCAALCPVGNLRMQWNALGQWEPADLGKCLQGCHLCLDVCPFYDNQENEDTLAAAQYGSISGIQQAPETGYYLETCVGYAKGGYRERGASGGLASWLLVRLLEQKMVDYVISVRPNADPDRLFEYAVFLKPEEIRNAASSAYYPVEMSKVMEFVVKNEGRYAIVALPCMAKAIRLACRKNRTLQARITFVLGLVCGQTKSKLFSEYCAAASGGDPQALSGIQFRKKTPSDFSKAGFECVFPRQGDPEYRLVTGWWDGMGRAWNNFAFTPQSCLYCDDVFAETADCAFMDAWLPEYADTWLGTSLLIVRNPLLNEVLQHGRAAGDIELERIPQRKIVESQQHVLENKRRDIAYRLQVARRSGRRVPSKRDHLLSLPNWFSCFRVSARMNVQRLSPDLWRQRDGLQEFLARLSRFELWPNRIKQLEFRLGQGQRVASSFFEKWRGGANDRGKGYGG